MPKLLIVGIATGLGKLLASRAADSWEVVGVDREPWESRPRNIRIHVTDLLKRGFESVFRQERPDAVVHLGFIRHFRTDPRVRHEVNVVGTRRLLENCAKYDVGRLVVLSSAYVYGALPENPYFLEEDAPLNADRNYPEIRDLAEVDTLCAAHLWKYPDQSTAILRPVNILGRHVQTSIGTYLRLPVVPTILGFNPMTQFIHEEDVSEALALSLEKSVRGIFNVTGPGEVPIKTAIREVGRTPMAIPETVARNLFATLFRLGMFHTPSGAIDFIKYPCTVSGARFRESTGFEPLYSLEETFAAFRG